MIQEQGVTPDSPPTNDSEVEKTQTATPDVGIEQTQKPPKGFVPYQALEEERSKRKELEEKLSNIPTPSEPLEDVYSDEGKMLKGDIKALNERLRSFEKKEERREVEAEFPIIKEKKADFDTFLEDDENSRLSIKKAAKLFLAEQNLASPEPPIRKGLEKPTSGGVTPPEPRLNNDEVEHMMKNDWRKYERLLREGKIV